MPRAGYGELTAGAIPATTWYHYPGTVAEPWAVDAQPSALECKGQLRALLGRTCLAGDLYLRRYHTAQLVLHIQVGGGLCKRFIMTTSWG